MGRCPTEGFARNGCALDEGAKANIPKTRTGEECSPPRRAPRWRRAPSAWGETDPPRLPCSLGTVWQRPEAPRSRGAGIGAPSG
eukprot:388720-Pyramimonas_sp.AAC.1